MVDRPPPTRFAVVEKGGRLVVIDKESGQTPPTAAQRMEAHDRALGIEPNRPAPRVSGPDLGSAARAESGLSSRPAPIAQTRVPGPTTEPTNPQPRPRPAPGQSPIAAALAQRSRQPWSNSDRPSPVAAPRPPAATGTIARSQGGQRRTVVTGKWWDAKGPRTIELGPLGQARLRSSLWALAGAVALIAIVMMLIEPITILALGFVLFRFGSNVFAPIGASIIDKALAEPN